MAVQSYYFLEAAQSGAGDHGSMQASAPATANFAGGWGVGALTPTKYADADRGTDVARTQTDATYGWIATAPTSPLNSTRGNAWRTPTTLNGSFPSANWTYSFVMRAATGTAQRGAMRVRLWRSANADGSGATEITAGAAETGITTNATTTNTTAITATVNPGAFSLANEYLFFQLAWKITTTGSGNTSVYRMTQDTNNKIVTADFTAITVKTSAPQALSSTSTLTPAQVNESRFSIPQAVSGTLAAAVNTVEVVQGTETKNSTAALSAGLSSSVAPSVIKRSQPQTLASASTATVSQVTVGQGVETKNSSAALATSSSLALGTVAVAKRSTPQTVTSTSTLTPAVLLKKTSVPQSVAGISLVTAVPLLAKRSAPQGVAGASALTVAQVLERRFSSPQVVSAQLLISPPGAPSVKNSSASVSTALGLDVARVSELRFSGPQAFVFSSVLTAPSLRKSLSSAVLAQSLGLALSGVDILSVAPSGPLVAHPDHILRISGESRTALVQVGGVTVCADPANNVLVLTGDGGEGNSQNVEGR